MRLINELDSREFLLNADTITIENQPAMKNPKNEKYSDGIVNLQIF